MPSLSTSKHPELWPPGGSSKSFAQRAASALGFSPSGGAWQDRFGEKLRDWFLHSGNAKPKVLSLFSGAGGLDIGFHDAGFDIIQMVELEEDFVKTLSANLGPGRYFESGKPLCIDIRDYHPPFRSVDFIIGGPPCQTFSAAGRRASGVEGTQEARGMLFREYGRLLDTLQPRGFLFENVYGMTGAEDGKSIRMVVEAFEELGYRLHTRVLDAADYGVPQHRERLIIVGLKEGEYLFPTPTHGPDSPERAPYFSAEEAVEKCPGDHRENLAVNGRHGHLLSEIPPGLNYSYFTEKLGHPNPIFAWRSKFSDYLYKACPDEPVRTIKAQGGQYTGPFHWSGRRFSLPEIKRLQTFPDRYEITGGRQRAIQQLGNSVPPQFSRILACSVLKQAFGISLPFGLPLLQPGAKLGFRQRKRERTATYQATAKRHISGREPLNEPRPLPAIVKRRAIRSEGYGFEFADTPEGPGYFVSAKLGEDEWKIHVGEMVQKQTAQWRIDLIPANSGVTLPFKKIEFSGDSLSLESYCCSWRFLERILSDHQVRDDLVQLFGYYQYQPSLRLLWKRGLTAESPPVERFIAVLAAGELTRATVEDSHFERAIGVGRQDLRRLLKELRDHGIDVRTTKTNPRIPANHLLIPYPFPTLNGQSVTGRKPLF